MAISIAQKQALIDNLQLELTERARRLRAQYNIQAQQLRSRVEMRINRIPTTLRKMKMGELLAKSLEPQQQPPKAPPKSPSYAERPPPVPAKDDVALHRPISRKPVPAAKATRGQKRTSEDMNNSSADKENHGTVENPKKRIRGGAPAVEPAHVQHRHGQILSPTSSNARIIPARERPPPSSPAKPSTFSRPASPVKGGPGTKASSSNLLSNMVEKAKGARGGGGVGGAALTRKVTTASSASSSSGSTAPRARKAAAPAAAAAGKKPAAGSSRPATATATRGKRKVSESSETSTGTVVKKTTGAGAAASSRATGAKTNAPAAKRTVMNTIKSATTKKAAPTSGGSNAKAHNASTSSTGRTLRKRG
ncbi:hypothetical protein UCREL1_9894 [Eutypa lata UCREL1]|uniref:Borealin N-terminal domain-containing protein n=1 Tax=Eutypa lata (strain UCR-EL1) TaxID=1287681 RepID=M7T974_EUTLA|nr:hypothetical protein UCREL1_9894 [Eutypa lata UCREL1]